MDDLATTSPPLPKGDLRNVIGSRLTRLRQARGWRQRELARRARVDPGRLSKLERGVNRISVDELIRLSVALGAGLDQIVYGFSTSLEGKWQRLFQDLERAGGPQALDFTSHLLQALALCLENRRIPEEGHGRL